MAHTTSCKRIIELLKVQKKPLTIAKIAEGTGLQYPTIKESLEFLESDSRNIEVIRSQHITMARYRSGAK